MALTRHDEGAWDSASSFGTGPFTTGSFTPPNNSLLIVACASMRDSGTNTTLGRPTITDSTSGGPLTYNEIDFANLTPFFSTQITLWYAEVATAQSMTISFDDPNNFTMYAYQACVFAFEGYDTATPVAGDIDSGTTNIADGSHSLTLTATPTANDYSLIFLAIDADGTVANPTLDTGWTLAFDQGSDTGGGIIVGLHRTGSTSTTCLVNDVYTGAGSFFKASMMALIVKAGAEQVVSSQNLPRRTLRGRRTGW